MKMNKEEIIKSSTKLILNQLTNFIKRFKIINQYFSLTFIQYNANFKKNSGCGSGLVGSHYLLT
jgi:hypothetical protein